MNVLQTAELVALFSPFKKCNILGTFFAYFKTLYTPPYNQAFLLSKKTKSKYIKTVFIVYRKTGMLAVGSGDAFTRGTVPCLHRHGIPHRVLDHHQMKQLYPMIEYPRDYTFVLDDSAGILMADKALLSYQVCIPENTDLGQQKLQRTKKKVFLNNNVFK